MGVGAEVNTHTMYGTVSHEHLDNLMGWDLGEDPDAGFNIMRGIPYPMKWLGWGIPRLMIKINDMREDPCP